MTAADGGGAGAGEMGVDAEELELSGGMRGGELLQRRLQHRRQAA